MATGCRRSSGRSFLSDFVQVRALGCVQNSGGPTHGVRQVPVGGVGGGQHRLVGFSRNRARPVPRLLQSGPATLLAIPNRGTTTNSDRWRVSVAAAAKAPTYSKRCSTHSRREPRSVDVVGPTSNRYRRNRGTRSIEHRGGHARDPHGRLFCDPRRTRDESTHQYLRVRSNRLRAARNRSARCQPRAVARSSTRFGWCCSLPPSTATEIPVMYAASSEARKATVLAMSSGMPKRGRRL